MWICSDSPSVTSSACSSDTGDDLASTVVPRSHLLSAPFSTEVQKQFSRYYTEFSELQLLGKGAFGAVIKVRRLLCNTLRFGNNTRTSAVPVWDVLRSSERPASEHATSSVTVRNWKNSYLIFCYIGIWNGFFQALFGKDSSLWLEFCRKEKINHFQLRLL